MEPQPRRTTQMADTSNDNDTTDLPSCEGCRKRKLRCSRQLPLCSNCERLDITCVYEGKKVKPGVKSGAVESLNRRLEIVENALLGKQQELDNPNDSQSPHNPSFFQAGQAPQPTPRGSGFEDQQNQVVGVLSSLSKEIRKLTSVIGSNASSTNHVHGSTNSRIGLDDYNGEPPSKRRRENETARISTSEGIRKGSLGSKDIGSNEYFSSPVRVAQLDSLMDVFFNRVQPWVPMLHVTGFPDILRDPVQRGKKSVVLHAIQVTALRHLKGSDGSPLDADYVAQEVRASRDYIMLSALDGLSVENLQALILLAFAEIGNGEPQKAWPLIGSLTRTVEYLHLAIESEDKRSRGGLLKPRSTLPTPRNWVEEEERRRVFWNIFNLDRFCSVTTGSNTSLTAADVSRRLPVCGGIWYGGKPAATPYFGIWDRSAAKIGNSITFLPEHYPSPSQTVGASPETLKDTSSPLNPDTGRNIKPNTRGALQGPPDMSNVGAFAYYIESLESLSRITTYFLQQEVDFGDRHQLTAWLTRFKELDLRLVHWKMFLPHQWKDSGMSRETMPGVMDPNMTIAHTTHNTSMILLHQRIAYPTKELMSVKLPSSYSAETCQSAAVETATITRGYLERSSTDHIVSPQLAFTAFISARVLLVHSNYYQSELAPEFWTLIANLDEMHRRWIGPLSNEEDPIPHGSLFGQFATRLRGIHGRCQRDTSLIIDVSGQFDDLAWEEELLTPRNHHSASSPDFRHDVTNVSHGSQTGPYQNPKDGNTASNGVSTQARNLANTPGATQPWQWAQPSQENFSRANLINAEDDLSAISQVLMNQQFMDMDRVISFEDVMHTSWDGPGENGLSGWPSTHEEASERNLHSGHGNMF